MQEQAQVVAFETTKAPAAPIAPSAPKPIDPSLLRQISGGSGDVSTTSSPNGSW